MKRSKFFRILTTAGIMALLAVVIPASPALAATRTIELDPEEGQIGDDIDVDGTGWPVSIPATSTEPKIENWVDVYFTSEEVSTNDYLDDDITNYELVKPDVLTDSDGEFSSSFEVPSELTDGDDDEAVVGGTYYVFATYANADQAKAVVEFTVIAGTIVLDPDDGVVGTEVDIEGEDFAENEEITIYYDGNELASDYIVEIDDETDNRGRLSATIIIPPSTAGEHTITVTDESISEAEAEFTVDPSLEVSPLHAPPGGTTEVIGTGFAGNKDVDIFIGDDEVATKKTDKYGSFSTTVNVPELDEGDYNIEADDGSNAVEMDFTIDIGTEVTINPVTSQAAPGYVGQSITMTGSGFDANMAITISLASTPQVVATTTSDASGNFTAVFNIPPSQFGAHTLTASDGSNTMSLPFYIEQTKPSIPAPMLPEDGGKAAARASFDWGDVTDQSSPVTYSLQVASDEAFSAIVIEVSGLTASEYTLPEGTELPKTNEGSPYYWRVRATDAASNVGDWSAPDSFHVGGFSFPGGGSWLIHLWWGLGATGAGFLGYYLGKRRAYYY
ncbi:MAG: hypothetical protein PHI12_01830 [Dehalococcoidales bacterium]|nr:hypothetical protein [Dehalococcoidales bacterium]